VKLQSLDIQCFRGNRSDKELEAKFVLALIGKSSSWSDSIMWIMVGKQRRPKEGKPDSIRRSIQSKNIGRDDC